MSESTQQSYDESKKEQESNVEEAHEAKTTRREEIGRNRDHQSKDTNGAAKKNSRAHPQESSPGKKVEKSSRSDHFRSKFENKDGRDVDSRSRHKHVNDVKNASESKTDRQHIRSNTEEHLRGDSRYRNESGEDEKYRVRDPVKKHDSGRRRDFEISEGREMIEPSHSHHDDNKAKRRRSRSQERTKEKARRSSPSSPKARKIGLDHMPDEGELSLHSERDSPDRCRRLSGVDRSKATRPSLSSSKAQKDGLYHVHDQRELSSRVERDKSRRHTDVDRSKVRRFISSSPKVRKDVSDHVHAQGELSSRSERDKSRRHSDADRIKARRSRSSSPKARKNVLDQGHDQEKRKAQQSKRKRIEASETMQQPNVIQCEEDLMKKKEKVGASLIDGHFTISIVSYTKDGNLLVAITKLVTVHKSCIRVRNHELQVRCFEKLHRLCLSNGCLLTVENVIEYNGSSFMISERVYDLAEFFDLELTKFRKLKLADSEWWDFIRDKFVMIFKDVMRGLMFLYSANEACGNLISGIFVTQEGRGRILPLIGSKSVSDVREVIGRMKFVISLPYGNERGYYCPRELREMFDVLQNYDKRVPKSFLFDCPFFWSSKERYQFVDKILKLQSQYHLFRSDLASTFESNGFFKRWWVGLIGVNRCIYEKGNSNNQVKSRFPRGAYMVTAYKDEVDIIRYIRSFYHHANDSEYRFVRGNKKLSDEELERRVRRFFPDFYINMFQSVCDLVSNNLLRKKYLKLIASCDFSDDSSTQVLAT